MLAKILYLMLPSYFANAAPIFVSRIKLLDRPVDFGKNFLGKRIFGRNKTWRGVFITLLTAVMMVQMQTKLHSLNFFEQLSLLDYEEKPLVIGSLIGIGTSGGDLIKSLFKRQINIKPGKAWVPFDGIDFAIGTLVLVSFVARVELSMAVLTVAVSFVIHEISVKALDYVRL